MIQRILFVMLVCLALITISVKGLKTKKKEVTEKVIPVPNEIATANDERYNKFLSSTPFWKKFETEMAKPAPGFIPPTAEDRAAREKERRVKASELARLKKISHEIPMKLISGEMPLKASIIMPHGGSNVQEAIYDLGAVYTVTSALISCSHTSKNNGVGWRFLISMDGKMWTKTISSGDQFVYPECSTYDIIPPVLAHYIKWQVSADTIAFSNTPADGTYTITIFDPHLYGFKTKS